MIKFVACQVAVKESSLTVYPLESQRQYLQTLIGDKFYTVVVSKYYPPRTTGKESQNHHINGHIQQIAVATGNDFDAVKLACKYEAISEGYPFVEFDGKMIPKSESQIDTAQAGILIETIHRIAAEYGVMLTEESDDR